MSLPDDLKSVLRSVLTQSRELKESSFLDHMRQQGGLSLDLSFDVPNQSGTMKDNFPSREARKALLLTARMFIQNNDEVSFGSLAKQVLHRPEVSDGWKAGFSYMRDELNRYLDTPVGLRVSEADLTHRDVLETCLYGHYAHTKAPHKENFEKWTAEPIFRGFVEFHFMSIVSNLVRFAVALGDICEMELEGRQVPKPPER